MPVLSVSAKTSAFIYASMRISLAVRFDPDDRHQPCRVKARRKGGVFFNLFVSHGDGIGEGSVHDFFLSLPEILIHPA